jgi:UDP-N-acetylglucosamine/UDP-N-acetylgalactosamine diphosphorylase
MPAVDAVTGHVLLSSPGTVALSPDGHGGLVAAMDRHGILEDAATKGIETFFYAQVDNPLVEYCDPLLIGYHLQLQSEMTTQVVQKRFANEKVGNVVAINGRVHIIEYSDLPKEVGQQLNRDGTLKLWAGNIAVHCIQRNFLERVLRSSTGLPFHRAHKSVPTIDAQARALSADTPNAIKFERFIFDLLPMAENSLVVEGVAARVFAPVKNADGAATDTPSDARRAISQLHKQWLTQAGATVSDDVVIEIHPAWALDVEEVSAKIQPGLHIASDTYFLC